jgi:hypothetical protein
MALSSYFPMEGPLYRDPGLSFPFRLGFPVGPSVGAAPFFAGSRPLQATTNVFARTERYMVPEFADYHSMLFMTSACQYYATARYAMYAQLMPVCGNLFHHAIEMSLKVGLAQKHNISHLKNMGHDLETLWRSFKIDFPDSDLGGHDGTISDLYKFENIRYPDGIAKGGMAATAQWSRSAARVTVLGGGKAPKEYVVVVSDIDDLIVDVFKACSWSPPSFIGTNPAALEALTRNNKHSEFLAKRAS